VITDGSFSDQRWWTFIPCGLDGPFAKQQDITLYIFNMLGQQVYAVSFGVKSPGVYRHELFKSDAGLNAAGVYTLRLCSKNGNVVARQFVLVRLIVSTPRISITSASAL
jgi:hypothetical protein